MLRQPKGVTKTDSSLNNLGLEIKRITRILKKAGLNEITVPSLLTASDLIDLYGEDLKLRAYTTSDPVKGEQVLRPDFTLPILLQHLRGNSLGARYFYSGNVWRRQNFKSVTPNEQYQMGFEFFDDKKTSFGRFFDAGLGCGIRSLTGDVLGQSRLVYAGGRRSGLARYRRGCQDKKDNLGAVSSPYVVR